MPKLYDMCVCLICTEKLLLIVPAIAYLNISPKHGGSLHRSVLSFCELSHNDSRYFARRPVKRTLSSADKVASILAVAQKVGHAPNELKQGTTSSESSIHIIGSSGTNPNTMNTRPAFLQQRSAYKVCRLAPKSRQTSCPQPGEKENLMLGVSTLDSSTTESR